MYKRTLTRYNFEYSVFIFLHFLQFGNKKEFKNTINPENSEQSNNVGLSELHIQHRSSFVYRLHEIGLRIGQNIQQSSGDMILGKTKRYKSIYIYNN